MRVTSKPKLIRALSMPKVLNTIYAVDFLRATHKCRKSNPIFCTVSSQIGEIYGISLSYYLPVPKLMTALNLRFQYYNKR